MSGSPATEPKTTPILVIITWYHGIQQASPREVVQGQASKFEGDYPIKLTRVPKLAIFWWG